MSSCLKEMSSRLNKNVRMRFYPFQVKSLKNGMDDPFHALHVDEALPLSFQTRIGKLHSMEIWSLMEYEDWKPSNCLLFRGLYFAAHVHQADGLQDHIAGDLQTFRADLVQSVLGSVVEGVVVTVVNIDHVGDRYAGTRERHVI